MGAGEIRALFSGSKDELHPRTLMIEPKLADFYYLL